MYCTSCGKFNSDDFKFCINCGAALQSRTDLVPQPSPSVESDETNSSAKREHVTDEDNLPKSPQQSSSFRFKEVGEALLVIAVVIYLLNKYGVINLSSLFQTNNNSYTSQSYQRQESFNTSDASIQSNGNLAVAMRKIQDSTPSSTWHNARRVPVSEISKNPYAYIGQLVRATGDVYTVQSVSPSLGNWTDVMIAVESSNSLAGVSTVEFLYNGSSSRLEPQSIITCAGYFIGTAISKNAFNADVEAIEIVGNSINGN